LLGPISGKNILEIGCGNGIQLIYILNKYKPLYATGIDINPINISIANEEKKEWKLENIHFEVNNSQDLQGILNNSFDLIICIESAFHYPDKQSFLNEVQRVLKPDGKFLVADLLFSRKKITLISKFFKKKMRLYNWTYEKYIEAFNISGLKILSTSDITNQVIRGFQNYPVWLSQIKNKNSLNNVGYSIFYKVILGIFIYLLKNRRIYEVFIGEKN
jgi:ubiquinone/menaquinone biosynthesis C-methylase UbiE